MRALVFLLTLLPVVLFGQSPTPVATWGKFVVRAPVGTPGEINYYSRPRSGGWLRWNTFATNDSANARLVCLSSDFFEDMIGDSMALGRSWASSHLQAAGSYAASSHTHAFADATSKPTTVAGYGITDFNSLGDARWSLLAHTHAFTDLTGKPTTIAGYGITDLNSLGDARWALSAHTHTFASNTSKPTTLSGYGITDAQAALTGTGFVKISGTTISYDNSTYLTSEVDGSTSNEIEVASQTGNANKYLTTDGSTTSWRARSFTNNASRTIQTVAAAANGWQISSTRDADVRYSVTITTAVQIGVATNVDGYVVIEVATTNSSTAGDWQEVARVPQAQNIGLALALSSTQKGGGQVGCIVPAGYYVRLRSVNVAGAPTFQYNSGQEVTL